MVKRKILLFGDTGKIGSAIKEVFSEHYTLICKNSQNFTIENSKEVEDIIQQEQPDIVVNTVVYGGVNQCEENPQKAFYINTLFPKLLAEFSAKFDFILVHFSTEAVFADNLEKLDESTLPAPVNMYGFTKYGADIYIPQKTKKYYIFRIPIQFGINRKNTQFVEKMLQQAISGQTEFNIANDVISMPSYNIDTVQKAKEIIENNLDFGLYHIASKEKASLYELFCTIMDEMKIDVKINKASYKDFDSKGLNTTCIMIKSKKIDALRSYKESIKDYCNNVKRISYGR